MEQIKRKIYRTVEFENLGKQVTALTAGQSMTLSGLAGSLLAFVAAWVFEERQSQVLLIASDEDRAERLRDDCALLAGEASVRFFGPKPAHGAQSLDLTSFVAQVESLKSLTAGERSITIATPSAIVQELPPPGRFSGNIIEITLRQELNFQRLLQRIQDIGFERKDFVESFGDFAVRGGIIDVFPYVGENPIRLEFWGDTVESIREFDVLSQRSIRELESASIVSTLNSGSGQEGEPLLLSSSIFEYLPPDAIIILDEPALIEREIEEATKDRSDEFLTSKDFMKRMDEFARIVISLLAASSAHIPYPTTHIGVASTAQPSFNGSINELVKYLGKLSDEGYDLYLASDTKAESERLKELIEDLITAPEKIGGWGLGIGDGGIAVDDSTRGDYGSHIADSGLPPSSKTDAHSKSLVASHAIRSSAFSPISNLQSPIHPGFLTETIHSGFILPSARLALLTEHEIFGRIKRRGLPKRKRFKGFSQKELHQLKRGDYIVHVDHGIGTFGGLKKIKVGGVEQEVMKLLFLENDVLYVNLNFVNRVQKYSSKEGHVPKLNRLGGAEWERAQARAKRRIKDIARDIIALYARRKLEKGFAFSPDTHWQKEMEASFIYEDTLDQATATLDVKADMESQSPMDRLVCGDVGFGKTEVAIRAAFKAVMDGKQVGVLVPTTILALQHFNTFQDRLSRYTTRVENITRFKSVKEQKKIIEGLKQGSVDIVIGTHRLLSKDVAFKDLGLLVIDEEHRFGVAAKEKLRALKASVDTLALTATPIPRTLHFSLIGARDLSLIATPPRNRLPIVTELVPGDAHGRQVHWQVIREAIVRELHRGGQAYVVHDRVSNIEAIADQVKKHVPEARVHVAHGQMSGHELEKTMLQFLERKYDVLVCTKIIESGLDIPSVNTIIVNRADMFGLAELYQLRGRVGRSNVQAYAYLLTPPLGVMPKTTLRRLQAIEEFTELGSGFSLAMRDLEIRGAGNLLGGEQSGFIMEMGFEMYERIVREAVEELRREEFKEMFQDSDFRIQSPQISESPRVKIDTVIDSDIDALIPDIYIESDAERLDLYRRLYKALNAYEIDSIRKELEDRFGEFPEEVENLLRLVELRMLGSQSGFRKISLNGTTLTVALPEESDSGFYGTTEMTDVPFQRMMKKIAGGELKGVRLFQSEKELTLSVALDSGADSAQRLDGAKKWLIEISASLEAALP